MARLEKAMRQYIDHEEKLKKADSTNEKLVQKYGELVDGAYNPSVQDAEKIYDAYQAVVKHDNDVNESREKMQEAAVIIKEYLEATHGKPISYTYPVGTIYPTYLFRLDEKGEITHNRKNRNNEG